MEDVMNRFLEWVVRLWNSWDARVMIIFSLALQILLTILGGRRKYMTRNLIKMVVWVVYLVADWVAIVGLGKLSEIDNNDADKKHATFANSNLLTALWAPLLLLHLGGPDTITAYSMEDNRLWLRHLLGLAVQASVTIYIIFKCWTNSWPFILTFPILLAGIIKYGERTWALRSVVSEEGFLLIGSFLENRKLEEWKKHLKSDATVLMDLELLTVAYRLFDDLKSHIVNLVHRRFMRWSHSYSIISINPSKYTINDIFKIIEFELGFIYDVLYTKATVIHTLAGSSLRLITFLCTVSALCGFSFVAKPAHANLDITITYVQLIGAIILEIYAIKLIIYSDWAILWMIKNHERRLVTGLLRFVAPRSLRKRRRWLDSMGQLNLLSYCLDDKPRRFGRILKFIGKDKECKMLSTILKFFDIDGKIMIKYQRVEFPEDLKKLILQMIQEVVRERAREVREEEGRQPRLFPNKGAWALERYGLLGPLNWIVEDFKRSIVIWHIATDICYYSTDSQISNNTANLSKLLSDYMMYLLVMSLSKFSFDTSQTDFWKNACNEVEQKLVGRPPLSEEELCKILIKEEPPTVYIYGSNDVQSIMGSMLEDAYIMAAILMEEEDKWKIISRVWVEMLCHVANYCQVNFHARQLSQGGELITYVWLLLLQLEKYSGD